MKKKNRIKYIIIKQNKNMCTFSFQGHPQEEVVFPNTIFRIFTQDHIFKIMARLKTHTLICSCHNRLIIKEEMQNSQINHCAQSCSQTPQTLHRTIMDDALIHTLLSKVHTSQKSLCKLTF